MGSFGASNRLRLAAALAFSGLLAVAYLAAGRFGPVRAARDADPNVIWSIGKTDGTGDEFALGAAANLTFEVGKSSPKDWRERQDASVRNASVYKIRFALDQVPASSPVLDIECYFVSASPQA